MRLSTLLDFHLQVRVSIVDHIRKPVGFHVGHVLTIEQRDQLVFFSLHLFRRQPLLKLRGFFIHDLLSPAT